MSAATVSALVALVSFGITDFIYKQAAARGIRADHALMCQAWFFCPLVILYALLTGTLVPVPAALWGGVAGALAFIGFFFFIRSLASGAVSTNSAIFRLSFIVTVLLVVVVLGERLTAGRLAGLGMALVATWLLIGAAGGGGVAGARRSLLDVGMATLALGASNFFHTLGLRLGAGPETLAVAQAAVFMPTATLVVLRRDGRLAPPRITFLYGAASAVMLLTATLYMLRGVAAGQASVVVPIAQMGFIVSALLGIVIRGEAVTAAKLAGLAAAVLALAALALS